MIRQYKKHLIAIVLLKLLLLVLLPITGDEAYFIKWANNLSAGYYDHPPMVGWLIYLMQFISDSHILYRLFSFLSVFVLSYFIYKILREFDVDEDSASLSALLFIFLPMDIVLILFTNDIPLLLFGTIGSYFLVKSFKTQWLLNSFYAGVFLGLSFLSKYLAVFLMFGLLLFSLISQGTKSFKNIAIVTLTILAFVAQNLYFNYNSCWNNIMFNFFARTEHLNYNISTPLNYLGMIVYLLTPWGIFYLLKSKFENKKLLKFVLSTLSIGLLTFLFISLKKSIGFHWLFIFLPFLVMFFAFLKEEYHKGMLKYSLLFTYLHFLLLFIIIFLPLSLFEDHKRYAGIVMYKSTENICPKLENHENLFTSGYTSASVLSYVCKRDVKVMLTNSKYGRFDDKLVDFRTLQNKTISLFDRADFDRSELESLFEEVEVTSFDVLGAKFYVATCTNLKYDAYKKMYLDVQREKFYDIPEWLPKGECYFLDRYYK